MIAIRAAKIATIAAIALFATLVAFGNITDYDTNLAFVQHVLSMDSIFERSTIRYGRSPRPHCTTSHTSSSSRQRRRPRSCAGLARTRCYAVCTQMADHSIAPKPARWEA
jgi:hypothetical protein